MTTPAAQMCTIMKTACAKWLTCHQLAALMGTTRQTMRRWLEELVDQGLFVERAGAPRPRTTGRSPMQYTVAREWGGQADV